MPIGSGASIDSAVNSLLQEQVDGELACFGDKHAHFDQTAGWYHRFGYYGGQYNNYPGEVSPVEWPPADLTGGNEHRVANYSGLHNIQSQPGPCSLVPDAWGETYNIGIDYTRTNLPYQTWENSLENTYTNTTNESNSEFKQNPEKYKKSSGKSCNQVCAQTVSHINPNPYWEASEKD